MILRKTVFIFIYEKKLFSNRVGRNFLMEHLK